MMKKRTYTAKITSKGQATIPMPIRDFAGLSDGDTIEFTITDNDEIVIKKKVNGCKLCGGMGKIESNICFGCDGTGEWEEFNGVSNKLLSDVTKYGLTLDINFSKIDDIAIIENRLNYPEEILNKYTDTLLILMLANKNIKILNYETTEPLKYDEVLLKDVLEKMKSDECKKILEEYCDPMRKVFNSFFNN